MQVISLQISKSESFAESCRANVATADRARIAVTACNGRGALRGWRTRITAKTFWFGDLEKWLAYQLQNRRIEKNTLACSRPETK